MSTTTDELPEALKTLMTAEPTPLKRLRNLWVSGLAKRDGHVVRAIAQDSTPPLTLLDLDQAIGVPGPAGPLVLQALAVQSVQYGQGPQLVAMPDAQGLRLNLIGNDYAPVASVKEPDIEFWEISISVVSSCLFCLVAVMLIMGNANAGWKLGWVGFCILILFFGLPAGAIFKRRHVSRDFYQRARSRR